MSEYVVVMTQIVGNVHHYEFVSSVISRHRTLAAAERTGIAELGHDDFNIIIRLGWQVAS